MTNPRSHTWAFQYDADGRLRTDSDPAGGSKTLLRTGDSRNFEVRVVTAEGRTASHGIEIWQNGTEIRRHVDDAGQITTIQRMLSGDVSTFLPDGTAAQTQQMPDPRFGIQAPLGSSSVQHAGGFFTSTSTSRSFELAAAPGQPVQSAHFSATFNGRTFSRFFEGATRTATMTSPHGRTATYRYDARGRITEVAVPGFAPVTMTWDSRGLLMEIAQGSRTMTITYDARRRLATMSDPLHDVVSFGYDNADRLTSQTLPGGRTVSLVPDANGNVTSVTPPERPPHLFSFDPVDMPTSYVPPGPGIRSKRSWNRSPPPTEVC